MPKKIALVSACLLGLPARYDGSEKMCEALLALRDEYILVPVCPEQLGGLATPRNPAEIVGTKVFDRQKNDVTTNFQKGAEAVLVLAKILEPDIIIFKERSPSCGVNTIYDGSFTGKKIDGSGITTSLLKKFYKVISEEDLG